MGFRYDSNDKEDENLDGEDELDDEMEELDDPGYTEVEEILSIRRDEEHGKMYLSMSQEVCESCILGCLLATIDCYLRRLSPDDAVDALIHFVTNINSLLEEDEDEDNE